MQYLSNWKPDRWLQSLTWWIMCFGEKYVSSVFLCLSFWGGYLSCFFPVLVMYYRWMNRWAVSKQATKVSINHISCWPICSALIQFYQRRSISNLDLPEIFPGAFLSVSISSDMLIMKSWEMSTRSHHYYLGLIWDLLGRWEMRRGKYSPWIGRHSSISFLQTLELAFLREIDDNCKCVYACAPKLTNVCLMRIGYVKR